jgi:hypothetical protein
MNLNSFLVEQALKKLKLSDDTLDQFRLASALGDVGGQGFPRELFELSAPVIIRGLLNFSVLQMNRDWVYPYWIHQQLDPNTPAFVARSQNPLLINITHRNWTSLGSPTGFHEAIVDPRGLVTPLPREWSVDTWLVEEASLFFPSREDTVDQRIDTTAPRIVTRFNWRGLQLSSEQFVGSVRGGRDVLFCRAKIVNASGRRRSLHLGIAIRPFGVEGVAPIKAVALHSRRVVSVDGAVGIVFAKEPASVMFGNACLGDAANLLERRDAGPDERSIACEKGLANAVAIFRVSVEPSNEESVCYSIALGRRAELRSAPVKGTWRVSFDKRREEQIAVWGRELKGSAKFDLGEENVQKLFEASTTALLQFQDGEFLSPGPYLYHHFWFRDAAPILKALDVLGFHHRVRQVIDGFPKRLTSDGFFRAPGGEWDSNGAVLWTVAEHYRLTRTSLWLKRIYPDLAKAGRWIGRMRRKSEHSGTTHSGLMPRSLSAEHLGTVDQYYWDSFWSLGGLRALSEIASEVHQRADARYFEKEAAGLERDILASFEIVERRLGSPLIPSTPFRAFDESSIGSIGCVYPLKLFGSRTRAPYETAMKIADDFLDERGFYHPIVHSGYNAYLTLQVAHALLLIGEAERAWRIAESVFKQATSTFTYPEAIHPKTGGGAMGDGHHGWAAAEVVLFLRDCFVREEGNCILLFAGAAPHLMQRGRNLRFMDAPTVFGKLSAFLSFESEDQCNLSVQSTPNSDAKPEFIDVFLPWKVRKISPALPHYLVACHESAVGTVIRFSPDISTAIIQLRS